MLGLQYLGTTSANTRMLYILQRHYQSKFESSIEDAAFRNEKVFTAGHLRNHVKFWEEEILRPSQQKPATKFQG